MATGLCFADDMHDNFTSTQAPVPLTEQMFGRLLREHQPLDSRAENAV